MKRCFLLVLLQKQFSTCSLRGKKLVLQTSESHLCDVFLNYFDLRQGIQHLLDSIFLSEIEFIFYDIAVCKLA